MTQLQPSKSTRQIVHVTAATRNSLVKQFWVVVAYLLADVFGSRFVNNKLKA